MATRTRDRWLALAVCGLLLLAVGLVFGQTVGYQFINLDDDTGVYHNDQVTGGLNWPSVAWAFTHRHFGNWDPLTWLSHMLDWQLYGPWAGGHHLTNVLLHTATAILLFVVLRQMTARPWPSALAAALFAVHPLRVESVAWVTERKDVLSGLFFMLTLWAYLGYVRRVRETHHGSAGAFHAPYWYLAVMVLFALALMAKPMVVTLPCVLLLLDYWPLGRFSDIKPRPAVAPTIATTGRGFVWRLLLEKVPLLVLVAGSCWVTVWAELVSLYEFFPLRWQIGNLLISYVTYLRHVFYPVDLAPLAPRLGPDLPSWQIAGAALILLTISAGAFALRRRCPYLLVGWLWYVGMLLPVIGLVPFGTQGAADRFTYLPQIGLCIAVAWGAADACGSRPYLRWAGGIASALLLAALTACAGAKRRIGPTASRSGNTRWTARRRTPWPTTSWAMPCPTAPWPTARSTWTSSTGRWPSIGRRSGSSPGMPRRTSTWASPWPRPANMPRQLTSTGRRSGSSRSMPPP